MRHQLWVVRAAQPPCWHVVVAPTFEAARAAAEQDGFQVLAGHSTARSAGAARFDVLLWCQELLALLDAGLELPESLAVLHGKARGTEAAVIAALLDALRAGQGFANALERQPVFPPMFVSLIRACEQTSNLRAAFERYIEYAVQMREVRQKLLSAAVYPALLVAAGGAVLVFLLAFVVPRFAGIYEGMHGELPWAARAMLAWGRLVGAHGAVVAIVAVSVLAVVIGAGMLPRSRAAFMHGLQALPLLGAEVRVFHLSRFYRTVGLLLEGGIALVRALEMASSVLPRALQSPAQQARQAITEGQAPSAAMAAARLSTPVADRLLAVGEQSGELGLMMTRIAQFHDAATARRLERAMRVVEPVLMAVIGIGIGTIVVLMYLPIFELAGALQ